MSEEKGEIRDVSDTAIWVAHYRAEESRRPDALFQDAFAKVLVGQRGPAIARKFGQIGRYTAWSVVSRTVIIDEFILKGIENGVDAVINLGAGLDTRPYRMNLPASFTWVEADFPHLIEYKQKMLRGHSPRCRLQCVGIDLADSAERQRFLASVVPDAHRVLVLTEGVVPYLTEAQVAELAADLKAQPRFAYWIVEYFAPYLQRYLQNMARRRMMKNAPFQFFPREPEAFFRENGWERKQIHYSSEVGTRFHRKPPYPWWASMLLRFAGKKNLERMRVSSGYMLLTPR